MAQIVFQPEVDGDRPVLEQIFPDGTVSTASVAVTVINKATDAAVATATGAAAQSVVDATLWLYDTADITGINLETVGFAQLFVIFTATLSTGGTIVRRQALVVNGAAKNQSLTEYNGEVYVDTVGGSAGTAYPQGLERAPVNSLADALTILGTIGGSGIALLSDLTLTAAIGGMCFRSAIGHARAVVDGNGQTTTNASFKDCALTGAFVGAITATRCDIAAATLVGEIFESGLTGPTITLAGGDTSFARCYSEISGPTALIVDVVGAGRSFGFRSHSGGIELRNMSDVSNVGSAEFVAGNMIIAATCSAGTLQVRGVVSITDNSTGTTVNAGAALDRVSVADVVWDEDVIAAHGGADTAGLLLRVLGALISQRGNNATLHALLGVADTAGVDLPEQINTELETVQGHGAGAWTAATGFAVPGDAMDLVTDAVDANAVATTGANEIRDTILSDATPFAGADIAAILVDTAAIDARLPSDPADESLQQSSHALTQAGVAAVQADTDDIQTRLPAALVGGRMDSDVAVIQAAARQTIADTLETSGTNPHGTGAWDATATVPAQTIRDAMKLAPTGGAPAAGSVDQHLDEIAADAAELNDTKITAARAANLDEITALRLAELDPGNIPGDIDALTTALATKPTLAAMTAEPKLTQIAAEGLVTAGATTTSVPTDLTPPAGRWDDMQVMFFDGAGNVRTTNVTAVDGAGTFTVPDLGFSPAAASAVIVVRRVSSAAASSCATAGDVAAARDEVLKRLELTPSLTPLTVAAGSTASAVRTNATEADDFFGSADPGDDHVLIVRSAANGAAARRVTLYQQTNGEFSITPDLPFVPASGDEAYVVARIVAPLGDVVTASSTG